MLPRRTPMYYNYDLNKKREKTDRTINTQSIQKYTFINRNSIHMRDRKKIVTCYPKQHIVVLSQLIRVKSWLSSPSDKSLTKKCHNIIYKRRLSVWICRPTKKRHTKSFKYHLLSNLKLFTSNPNSQVVTTRIIRMSREI